jgi:oligoribonuclease NrnB/cAMP/cGMP phosphodiesterase (DHH superfamily)
MEKDTVLFYHDRCPDGFGSAYAFWSKFGDSIAYQPLNHNDMPNLDLSIYKDKRVFMADICFKRKQMLELNDIAGELLVLDHHKTAMEDLKGLDFCRFDMNRSGAIMSWDYLFKRKAPRLLRFIQDRDLWTWNYKNSEKILLYVDSMGFDFNKWKDLEIEIEDGPDFSLALEKGQSIMRYRDRIISNMMGYSYTMNIRGYNVPVINAPFFRSEMVGAMAQKENIPFAAGYNFDGEFYMFSLRSRNDGVDVAKIAESFPGGGGHRCASGFTVKSLDDLS